MGKPTKYTPDTTKKLLDAIRGGFTVKMACAMSGVTDMALSRWRRQHLDFDTALKKPPRSKLGMVERLSKGLDSGFMITPAKPKKVLRGQINGSESQNQQGEMIYEGLPVRLGSLAEGKPYLPCVNPSNGRVEYLKREHGRNVQHICDISVFKRSFPGWYRKIRDILSEQSYHCL